MGRHAHAFLAAADHDARVADAYRLGADRHGAQAGTAELVDLVGGALIGDTRLDGRLAGWVLALTGGEDLAEDGLVDFGRLDLGALQRLFDRQRAELRGSQAGQASIEGPDRSAGRACNYALGHLRNSPFRGQAGRSELTGCAACRSTRPVGGTAGSLVNHTYDFRTPPRSVNTTPRESPKTQRK